ncbi:MAG TPA: vWA domain-containing protein, partial [Thermoanaerobaculia bacterium]|nr:vWA domain-containing protein [Thermoanaerobaculia bacterium]
MNLALCRSTAARTVVAAALLPSLLLLAGGAFADDRDLFRASSTSPLVMTILDTSASMHLQPDGSFAPAGADDPNSRFYQAKAALYEVIDTLGGDLVFGWAHFNQEEMQVLQKRWLYAGELTSGDPASPFAPTGGPISLGPRPAGLTVGSACNKEDLLVASSMEAVELFPKLGAGTSDTLFVLLGLQELRIDFSLSAGALGDESATLTYSVASVPGCGGEVGGADVFTVALSPAYTADLDLHPFETGRGFDYLQYSEAIDTPFPHPVKDYDVRSACDPPSNDSWMANENGATTDPLASERLGGRANGDDGDEALAYDNFPPPSGPFCTTQGNPFVRGDIVPFDWLDRADGSLGWEVGARAEIRRRLAPNTAFDPGAAPDFRIARYFQPAAGGGLELVPQPVGGLAADRYPPILTGAGTPLAGVLDDLHHYFSEFTACAEDETEGDVRFPCRQRYLILVTDGEENCDGAVAAAARSLQRDHGFKIFVIGFGADVDAGELQTIADEGGTGTFDVDGDGAVDCEELSTSTFDFCPGPQVAADKMELVAALDRAFGAVQPNPATFSAATAPEASADTDDSIFLSTFFPVDFTNTYPGKLFHFIRPLPLRQDAAG